MKVNQRAWPQIVVEAIGNMECMYHKGVDIPMLVDVGKTLVVLMTIGAFDYKTASQITNFLCNFLIPN